MPVFISRQFSIVDLPLAPQTKILRPEQVVIRIDRTYVDVGAFCYLKRSSQTRKPRQPRGVVLSSLVPHRIEQISKVIRFLSAMLEDGASRPRTVLIITRYIKAFFDWVDVNDHCDCLAGGAATVAAFHDWAAHVGERYHRYEIQSTYAFSLQTQICDMLEQVTGQENLRRGVRIVSLVGRENCVEAAPAYDFAQVLALNQALFDGICDLVLENHAYPFKLKMPDFLGWEDSHLWLFPRRRWSLPRHFWGVRENFDCPDWAYDYENGRIATVGEILHRYDNKCLSKQRFSANKAITQASLRVEKANADAKHSVRIDLAMIAQAAFLFLFLSNTGCNMAVARDIETDENIDISTLNQNYRVLKYRAQRKVISVVSPASFMPTLRRFMQLRKYLLGDVRYPYLFFTLGHRIGETTPDQIHEAVLGGHYQTKLLKICPSLPRITARKIRATVSDYYRRSHDGAIAARIMGHSEAVADRNYLAGSPVDQQDEITLFLDQVSVAARSQKVVHSNEVLKGSKSLEEGGKCSNVGYPQSISVELPIPDCKQGCLFCSNRILVANEDDARKVASAAFVMEQLILGPLSEVEFRPKIKKCDDDLEKIAGFDGCKTMVERVRRDVYENGNLTPYFADKYQMFLELGVL